MTAKSGMLELLSTLHNIVEVFQEDPEQSEFEDVPFIIEKLEQTMLICTTAFPFIQISEDLIFGEITPAVFMKKWARAEEAHEIEKDEVDEIGSEVTGFLGKFSNPDAADGSEGENVE